MLVKNFVLKLYSSFAGFSVGVFQDKKMCLYSIAMCMIGVYFSLTLYVYLLTCGIIAWVEGIATWEKKGLGGCKIHMHKIGGEKIMWHPRKMISLQTRGPMDMTVWIGFARFKHIEPCGLGDGWSKEGQILMDSPNHH